MKKKASVFLGILTASMALAGCNGDEAPTGEEGKNAYRVTATEWDTLVDMQNISNFTHTTTGDFGANDTLCRAGDLLYMKDVGEEGYQEMWLDFSNADGATMYMSENGGTVRSRTEERTQAELLTFISQNYLCLAPILQGEFANATYDEEAQEYTVTLQNKSVAMMETGSRKHHYSGTLSVTFYEGALVSAEGALSFYTEGYTVSGGHCGA